MRGIRAEDLVIEDAAHPKLAHRVEASRIRGGIRIGGNALLQPFDHAEACTVEQGGRVQHLGARRRQRADPREERESFQQPPHDREVKMCVGVDQPRQEHRVAQVLVVCVPVCGRRVVAWADPDNRPALDDDRAVANGGRRDRQHPGRVVAHLLGQRPTSRHGFFLLTTAVRGGQERVGSVPAMK